MIKWSALQTQKAIVAPNIPIDGNKLIWLKLVSFSVFSWLAEKSVKQLES